MGKLLLRQTLLIISCIALENKVVSKNFELRLLGYWADGRDNQGFTLLELLVVIIIIGVLAAIAVPSLLTQAGKARETEAKESVGTFNNAQQAYQFEHLSFANASGAGATTTVENLLGISLMGTYYAYTFGTSPTFAVIEAQDPNAVANQTRPYVGGINTQLGNYSQIICQGDSWTVSAAPPQDGLTCPDFTDWVQIK